MSNNCLFIPSKKESLPVNIEFSVASPSFVERGGFITITDKNLYRGKGLPRWSESPMRYLIDEEGYVWKRHFAQSVEYCLAFQSVDEFINWWREKVSQYLQASGCECSIEDLKE